MYRLFVLTILALIAWRLLRRLLPIAQPRSSTGFNPDPEALVRCDRCGVRIPASQVATVRANCRQCGELGSQP